MGRKKNHTNTSSSDKIIDTKIYLSEIVSSLPVGVFIVDANENVVYANPAAETLFGEKNASLKSHRFGDFISCVNRTENPSGCSYSANCPDCPLLNGIRSIFSENGRQIFTGEVELFRDDISHQMWINYHAQRIEINKQTFVILTVQNITDEKLKNKKLFEANERFQAAFKGNPNAVVISSQEDGVWLDVNQASLDMFGYNREEAVGTSALGTNLWVDVDDRQRLIAEVTRSGEVKSQETLLRRKNGSVLTASVSAKALSLNGVKHLLFIAEDISERKQVERTLRESESKFAKTFKNAPLLMSITSIEDGRFMDVNDAFVRITGFTREMAVGSTSTEIGFIKAEDRIRLKRILEIKGSIQDLELEVKKADKTEMICLYSCETTEIEGKYRLLSIARDITKQKVAEKKLQESEQKWRNILIKTPQIGITLDTQAKIVFANEHFLRLTGWNESEIIGSDWFDRFIPKDVRKDVQGDFDNVMQSRESAGFSTYENEILTKSGERLNVAWSNVLTGDPNGSIVDVTCLGIDLTERKRAEEALTRRAEFERLISKISSDFVKMDKNSIDSAIDGALSSIGVFTRADRAYIFQYKNSGTEHIDNTHEWCAEGIEPQIEGLRNITFKKELPWFAKKVLNREVIHLPDMNLLPAGTLLERQHFEEQKIQSLMVVPMVSGDRDIGFLGFDSVSDKRVWTDDDQNLLKLTGQTITHALLRNRSEEDLRISEEKLNFILDSLPDMILEVDPSLKILWANKTALNLNHEALGNNCYKAFPGNETVCHDCSCATAFKTGRIESGITYQPTSKTAGESYWENIGVPLKDKNGNVSTVLEVSRNVTQREQTIRKLRESEERYADTISSLNDIVWQYEVDAKGRFVSGYISPVANRFLGLTDDQIGNSFDKYFSFVLPEDLPAVKKILTFISTAIGEEKQIEYRLKKSNGVTIWVNSHGTTKRQPNGNISLFGITADITERKQAEEELRQSEKDLRASQRIAHVGSWRLDLVTDQVTWTKELYNMYGFDPALPPPPYTEHMKLFTLQSWERLSSSLSRTRETGIPYELELETLKNDGTKGWMWVRGQAERDTKGNIIGLWGAAQDITERKQSELALKESEERFKALHNASFGGICIHDNGLILECNKGLSELTGYQYHELIGMDGLSLISDDTRDTVVQNINTGYEMPYEAEGVRKNGELYPLRLEARKIPYKGKNVRVVEFRDITENKRAEEEKENLEGQLRHAQKMEAIGRLAGGVAHDFNNMLSVIIGNANMAMEDLNPDDPVYTTLEEIINAGERSADLTRQLLAFARRQTIAPKILNLNKTVGGMTRMLQRLIGEDIELSWLPGGKVWPVKMDPSQVDQILANLCVNARDAIADVGKVTIETTNVAFDHTYCTDHTGFLPGEYVLLAVSDNGCGMDTETLEKIFEPFFTTKESSKGTGLSLATVYGVVKQNHGFVNVYSEPGHGTTFKIYLPRHLTKTACLPEKVGDKPAQRGHETILLVEDEPSILRMTTMMLARFGYFVVPAKTPGKPFALLESTRVRSICS